MPDFCNNCSACCYPQFGWERIWRQMKWLREDGSCKHLNLDTHLCDIYERRPVMCRLDNGTAYSAMMAYCDRMHQQRYGCPREHPEECKHRAQSL